MEELTDILVGLEQRITAYQNRLQELEKKRRRLDDEITTIKKYLELAETLHRVEADKIKVASFSAQSFPAEEKELRHLQILLGRSQYAGKTVPEAAYQLLREANRPMHAKKLVQRLLEGGLNIKGKTPLTSVATSLKREKRFRKVGPNRVEALQDILIQAV